MSDSQDAFFVGYLRTPRRIGLFLKIATAGSVVVSIVLSALLAGAQRDPGAGNWETKHVLTVDATLWEKPYPVLTTGASSFLLVDQGKRGAATRVAGFDGYRVRVRGHTLERGPLRLFEIADEPNPVKRLSSIPAPAPPVARAESTADTLVGEIVDPKCFSGAMKPGDGKTHKACAALCLRGGIPPVLVVASRDGSSEYYILTGRFGEPVAGADLAKVVGLAGERVEVEGAVERRSGLRLLKAEFDTLRRR